MMNDDILMTAMDYTPDEIFHALSGEEALISVMSMTPDDLMHHGIKGQKWGIRRFQPYRQGMKVAGGKVIGAAKKVKQRFKDAVDAHKAKRIAKTEAKAEKKQAKEEKKIEDFEAEKQKAIKTGTAEDLAKFKGKLTPQEYSEAFLRLQNEKKLSDLVDANKKSVWDTADKIIATADKLAGYADTATKVYKSVDKLKRAMDGDFDDKPKKDKHKHEKEVEELLTKGSYEDLMKSPYRNELDDKDYKRFFDRQSNEAKTKEAAYKEMDEKADKKTPKDGTYTYQQTQNIKTPDGRILSGHEERVANKYQKSDIFKKWGSEAAIAEANDKDAHREQVAAKAKEASSAPEAAVESGKRVIKGFNVSGDKITKYNNTSTLEFGESAVKRFSASAPNRKDLYSDMAPTQAERDRATRMDNVRNAYSMNRKISGAKTDGESGTKYTKNTDLEFGKSSVKRFSAAPLKEGNILKETRSTVQSTQDAKRYLDSVDKLKKRQR